MSTRRKVKWLIAGGKNQQNCFSTFFYVVAINANRSTFFALQK